MRKLPLALGLLLLLGAALVQFLPSGSTAQAATTNVSVKDDFFDQANITITAGGTVQWTWAGSQAHSVTADDNSFDSNPAPPSAQVTGTFDHTFSTPGTYSYYCRIHGAPGGVGMSGVITVQAAAPTATNTTVAQVTSTNTPAATATATVSGTSTATATAGATQTATATPAPQPTTAAVPSATRQAGAAGAGASLPNTGAGDGGGGWPSGWLALALAAGGIVVIATGLLWRRRA